MKITFDKGLSFSLVSFILLIMIGATYFNSVNNPFYYDDYIFISESYGLSRFSNIKHIFNQQEYFQKFEERTYRPVNTVIYLVLKQIFGNSPPLWRLFNLALHFFNCCLLFIIFRRFGLDDWSSLLATTIFAVHTVHTELINIVSFNEDLIGGFFFLLAFKWYFSENRTLRVGSILLYFLSCFVKEIFFLLPFLCFIFAWSSSKEKFSSKKFLKDQSGYLAVAIFFLIITFFVMKNPSVIAAPTYPGGSIFSALLTFTVVSTYYLKLLFWPTGLSPIYDFPIYTSILDGATVFSSIILVVLIGIAVFGLFRKKTFAMYLAWFLLFILPTSNIIPYGAILADHYLYVPFMGLIPGVLLLMKSGLEFAGLNSKKPIICFGIIFLIMLSVLTVKRNAVWQNPETLWKDTIKKAPNTIKPHFSLGLYYSEQQAYDLALKEYQHIITARPSRPQGYYNIGNIYLALGMFEQARGFYEEAFERRNNVKDNPGEFKIVMNLGIAYLNLKDYEAALKYLDLARTMRPDYPNTYYNLSLVYEKLGQTEEAQKALQTYGLRK